MKIKSGESLLYETDYYVWLKTTLKQLQEKDINNLDWQHLIEEIEALANEQKRQVASYLKQLLKQLLIPFLKKKTTNFILVSQSASPPGNKFPV